MNLLQPNIAYTHLPASEFFVARHLFFLQLLYTVERQATTFPKVSLSLHIAVKVPSSYCWCKTLCLSILSILCSQVWQHMNLTLLSSERSLSQTNQDPVHCVDRQVGNHKIQKTFLCGTWYLTVPLKVQYIEI